MFIKFIELIILKVHIVYRKRIKERWMLWRYDLIVGYNIDRMAGSREDDHGEIEKEHAHLAWARLKNE